MRKTFLPIILTLFCIEVEAQQDRDFPKIISELTTDELIDEIFEGENLDSNDEPVVITPSETVYVEAEINPSEDVSEGEEIEIADKDRQLYMYLGIGGLVVAAYIGYQMSVKNKLLAEQIKQAKS